MLKLTWNVTNAMYNAASTIPVSFCWSLGNEAGFGPNLKLATVGSRMKIPAVPYNTNRHTETNLLTSTAPCMLITSTWKNMASVQMPRKPLIQCEYAHAMGNSQGGFKEYWDLIRNTPTCKADFIWDFVDQSVRWKGKDGVTIYAYGGDFNRYDGSDKNFCDNGLISPDRVPNPHMYEVGYYYQNIWTTPADLKNGEVNVYNENFFRDLSGCYLEWEMLKDGKVMRSGRVDDLNVAPQQTAKVKLDLGTVCQCAEWLLNVSYKLKERERAASGRAYCR